MAATPRGIKPISRKLVSRGKALVKDVDVDPRRSATGWRVSEGSPNGYKKKRAAKILVAIPKAAFVLHVARDRIGKQG